MRFLLINLIFFSVSGFAQQSREFDAYNTRFKGFIEKGILSNCTCDIKTFSGAALDNLYSVAEAVRSELQRLGYGNLSEIKDNKVALTQLREAAAKRFNEISSDNSGDKRIEYLISKCSIFPSEFSNEYISKLAEPTNGGSCKINCGAQSSNSQG